MPITSFTIDGVEYNPLFETLDIRETVGAVSTMAGDVISIGSPVLRIAVFSEVEVEEDGVKIFSGTVMQARERGFGGPNLYTDGGGSPPNQAPQIVTTITAEDHYRILERVSVTLTIADGTLLKAALTSLVALIDASLGITLDAAQVNGPALPNMQFERVKVAEIVQAFSDATGYLSRVGYDKALRMWLPGDIAAPFNVDEFDDPARWTGDVEVEAILGDGYANRVIVIAEPRSEEGRIESFTGDGVTSTYTLTYTLTKGYGIIHRYEPDGITPAGGETFAIIGTDTFTQWEYDPTYNTIARVIGPTDAGYVYRLKFDGFFTAEATAEDAAEIAAHGLYEHIERRSDITDEAMAQELADALLAQMLNAGEQKVTYETRFVAPTLRAGQQQTIQADARDLSGTYIVTDLRVRAETPATATYAAAGLGLIRSVSLKKTQPLIGRYQDTYRDWLIRGGGGIASVAIGDGGPASLGAAPPLASNQFNRGGEFGGHASWGFDEAYTTARLGTGHTSGGADNMLIGEGHTVL
jgi:hypothetical protein